MWGITGNLPEKLRKKETKLTAQLLRPMGKTTIAEETLHRRSKTGKAIGTIAASREIQKR